MKKIVILVAIVSLLVVIGQAWGECKIPKYKVGDMVESNARYFKAQGKYFRGKVIKIEPRGYKNDLITICADNNLYSYDAAWLQKVDKPCPYRIKSIPESEWEGSKEQAEGWEPFDVLLKKVLVKRQGKLVTKIDKNGKMIRDYWDESWEWKEEIMKPFIYIRKRICEEVGEVER